MIFFVGNDGTIVKSFPEYVYQGAANTNTIYLIAPFAVNSQVTVTFQLPNGTRTSPVAMTPHNALQNIVNKETGQTYAGWTYALPNNITQNFGVLTVQFFFYSASAGVITATSSAKLTVAKGVPSVLPETPSEDVYEAILSNIAALQEQLNNGTFAARSIYAWNSTYTYGANEITFYPSIGDYGAFVQSLQAGNTGNQPYNSDGTLNATWWKEVVNFNTITEDFFGEIKEQADLATTAAQNAATSETNAAQSASAAAASESAAETAADTATEAAESAVSNAETAVNSANAAAASANASAASASQANNSAIAANNSAIAAANSAAQIEDMKTTFALKDESASSLDVSLNNATFVLTMTLKDIDGNTLSTQTVDFPIESMVVGISYNEATKTLIFQLQSGSTIEVPIDDIVDGLATQTALDNVINGTTPVAKATAADTAGQVENALTVVTNGVSQQYNGSAPLTVTINTTSNTDPESVHFTAQTLNESQQSQARENIGAVSVAELNDALEDGAGAIKGQNIPENGDLNNYTVESEEGRVYGWYHAGITSSNTLANTPYPGNFNTGFYLLVLQTSMKQISSNSRLFQLLFGVCGNYKRQIFIRSHDSADVPLWTPWKKLATEDDLQNYLPLTGGTINGNVNIQGNFSVYPTNATPVTIDGTINATGQVQEVGQRVYSPNNKPAKSDVGLGNVDNVRQYSASNPQTEIGGIAFEKQSDGQIIDGNEPTHYISQRVTLWSGSQTISSNQAITALLDSQVYRELAIYARCGNAFQCVHIPASYSLQQQGSAFFFNTGTSGQVSIGRITAYFSSRTGGYTMNIVGAIGTTITDDLVTSAEVPITVELVEGII